MSAWTGNDWHYDGCADCIVGEPHVCFQYERVPAVVVVDRDLMAQDAFLGRPAQGGEGSG